MTNEPLKQALVEHYQNQRLPDDAVQALIAVQGALKAGPENVSAPQNKSAFWNIFKATGRHRLGLVFAAILALVAIGIRLELTGEKTRQQALLRDIVAEVAMNHLKAGEPNAENPSYETLRQKLDALPFHLVESSRTNHTDWSLASGKYCTIRGQMAAQLQYLGTGSSPDSRGGPQSTMYQCRWPEDLSETALFQDGKTVHRTALDGLVIELWREQGLLMVWAKEPISP